MTTTNPTPTQQETLLPCPMDHSIVNGVRFTDFSNEYRQHIWCYDCGLEFEGRVDETAESVAQRWNTRRAAVAGPLRIGSEVLKIIRFALTDDRKALIRYSLFLAEKVEQDDPRLATAIRSYVEGEFGNVIATTPAESDDSWEATLAGYRQQINAMESDTTPPERTRVEGEQVAHRCSNGEVRPYPPILCSMCQQVYGGMSVNELCEAINRAATISDSARRAAEFDAIRKCIYSVPTEAVDVNAVVGTSQRSKTAIEMRSAIEAALQSLYAAELIERQTHIPTADTGLNCVYNRHSYCTKAYCDCTCHAAAHADNDAESLLQLIAYIRERRDYFAAKDLHNGWSGRESGPCCERCTLLPEHFTGHADALKALAGCRNPFQLPEVCQCHIPVREAVRAGIIEAHDQLLRRLV